MEGGGFLLQEGPVQATERESCRRELWAVDPPNPDPGRCRKLGEKDSQGASETHLPNHLALQELSVTPLRITNAVLILEYFKSDSIYACFQGTSTQHSGTVEALLMGSWIPHLMTPQPLLLPAVLPHSSGLNHLLETSGAICS